MLKLRINSLSEVDAKYQGLYIKQEDGTYKLDVSMLPDTSGLKNTNASLLEEKRKIKEQKEELEKQLADIAKEKEKEAQELLLKEKKYEELLNLKETEHTAAIQKAAQEAQTAHAALQGYVKDNTLNELATTLAGSNAALIKPHLAEALEISLVDGIPKTTFKIDGVEVTRDVLEQKIREKDIFKPILTGRKSSGGGAGGAGGGGGNVPEGKQADFFNPKSENYSLTEQIKISKENPSLYKQLTAKFNLDDPYHID